MPGPASRADVRAKKQSEDEKRVEEETRSRAANLVTGDGKPFNGLLSQGKYGTAETVFSLDLLPKIKMLLLGDEYGKVQEVKPVPKEVKHFHSTWFHSGDKHGFRVWGVDDQFKVVCAFRAEYATGNTDEPTSVTVVCMSTTEDYWER